MVRLKGPLFSMEASGTVASAVTFAKWKGRDYARRHAIPSNPKSALQTGVRAVFKWLSQNFANLATVDRSDWAAAALADNLTPLNAQIRDGVALARRNLGWRENRLDAAGTAPNAPTTVAATAQPKTIVLTWVDPITNLADQCIAVYRNTATMATPDISNLVAIVDIGVLTYTDSGLTSGQQYFYKLRGLRKAGTLGAFSTEANGTPT